eukprot:4971174-Amphidinium_carterae.1
MHVSKLFVVMHGRLGVEWVRVLCYVQHALRCEVHRSCLNQWRSKGMVTNQKAMTHCPSCNFEYDIYCTADIQDQQCQGVPKKNAEHTHHSSVPWYLIASIDQFGFGVGG